MAVETFEGSLGNLWFHYDVSADVLYLRLESARQTETVGEESHEGHILLRDIESGNPVGITIINWWKRFGKGDLPDSIKELEHRIEPWAKKVAA